VKVRVSEGWGLTITLVLVILVGCVLRCWNINQSFWWDEIWGTIAFAKASSLWQVVSSLGYYFNNHIFYSLLARGSIKILGESEIALRLPALVMGLLGIVMLFQFGKSFLGASAGIIASLLLAISAFHIDHSSEARGYSALALFSILSSFYFLKGLKTDRVKFWILYAIFTVLGFYSHVFMIAVSISQFLSALLFIVMRKWTLRDMGMSPRAFKNFFLSLFLAGIATIIIYTPVLSAFVANIGKVRLVHADRMPFMVSLLNSFFPGVQSIIGSIIYSILILSGIYFTFRKDRILCCYFLVLSLLPVSLYLLINPMFVFERYFIFALPFVLLIVSEGVVGIAGNFKGFYQKCIVIVLIFIILCLQFPAIHTIIYQDRQDYREAVRFVESEVKGGRNGGLVFSIGYAGEHFRYYSRSTTIVIPETLRELFAMATGKKRMWCLITAWLPAIRPPYEDQALYAERPGQYEIYNYVRNNFHLQKYYPSKYPVLIYYLEQ
jgi:uncharacterized membrane protein